MPVQQKKLRVLPNPWTHIDEKGHANGVCIVEQPGHGAFDRRWVGAHISSVKEIEPAKRVSINGRMVEQKAGIHHCKYSYVTEPVVVENTAYYRKMVSKGDLIAADVISARSCGISTSNFVEPALLLEQIKKASIEQFELENGAGAYDALAEIELEEDEQEAAVAKAVAEANGDSEPVATDTVAPVSADGPAMLEGVTLPADGTTHEVALEAIAGGSELPALETDASGNAVLVEQEAPALTNEPNSRRRSNKGGTDQ